MSIFAQFRYNGILYTLKAQPTRDFPSDTLPYGEQLEQAFKDIAENHSAAALEAAETPNIHQLKNWKAQKVRNR